MLVMDSLGRLAGGTRNADDSGGEIRENQADNAIVTAAFHLRDSDRSAETQRDAEVMDLMLKGRERFVGVFVGRG